MVHMGEPKYIGFGSIIDLDTLGSAKKGHKENEQCKTQRSPKDNLNVDMSFFTVNVCNIILLFILLGSRKVARYNQKLENSNIEYKVNPAGVQKVQVKEALKKCFGQGFNVESRPSPTNTASNESFYSCRSAGSQADDREEDVRRETSSPRTTGRRNKNSRDEELFNQLTMVNAIFLNNSVECIHDEASRNGHGDNISHKKSSNSTPSAKFQKRFPEDQTHMHGDNASVQKSPKMRSFEPNSLCTKRVDSVTSIIKEGSGKSFEKRVEIGEHSEKLLKRASELAAKDKCISSYASSKIHDSSGNKTNEGRVEQMKQKGGGLRFVETHFLKQSFVEDLPEMGIDRLLGEKLKEINFSDVEKRGRIKPLKRLERVDKRLFMKNLKLVNDSRSVSSISKILKSPSRDDELDDKGLSEVDSTSNNNKKSTIISQSHLVDTLSVKEYSTEAETSKTPKHHKSMIIIPPLNQANTTDTTGCLDSGVTKHAQGELVSKELPTISFNFPFNNANFTYDDTDVVYMEEKLSTIKRRNRSRKACRLICPLPVIKEESSESLVSNASEESNVSDDYCLVDNCGRSIHLFDNNGLPLTDNHGRPLRDAEGRTLLLCDLQGVPLVDASTPVFDHSGRHALDPRFSPWGFAPAPPTRRLCKPSGGPLHLFDSHGRPLTGAGGELLLDREGRPLLKLNL